MVSRKKVETAGSCHALLPLVEGNAAGTGLEDVSLERNDADDDVQGRVADPNTCGSLFSFKFATLLDPDQSIKITFKLMKNFFKNVLLSLFSSKTPAF